ncbi:MAG: CRISPR-associated endonuclease Cas2 [Melioribacteraceae bacterium]|nr:CRISPR-associated endonuclease Cas2 [Melioribacteraceae bacterium]
MFIISYDIVKNKNRVKIAKILEDYGFRVQYSVFECDLIKDELSKVISMINNRIDIDKDSIKIYFLCKDCQNKILSIGKLKERGFQKVIVI